jgi:argininosuccinate lyase
MRAACAAEGLYATDFAEALVRDGVPFRDAHERVAESVRQGTFEPAGDAAASVAARDGIGPGGVTEAIAALRRRFGDNL